jgi:uncharacterized protein YecE (DUF72 family)
MRTGRVHVGCSGWQYQHWRSDFYPARLAQSRWFAHYALSFDTVEINNSFYRLPPPETFAKWREQAPPRFVYSVKASRFLTHMKKLKDPYDPLVRFFDNARELGGHLGPVLYQLPPNFGINLERLETFLRTLPGGPEGPSLHSDVEAGLQTRLSGNTPRFRHVMEFRDPCWYVDDVYELLDRYDVALCLHDMQGSATGRIAVGPFIYVRYHFGDRKYGGAYDDRRLDAWGEWLSVQASGGRDVYAYFNNDTGGHAPRDAVRLRERIQSRLAA